MVILFDQFHLPENVFDIIFATEQQSKVARMLIEAMKEKGGYMGKTEMSMFATALHEGTLVDDEPQGLIPSRNKVKISYNKRQFYDRILTPMKSMGLIDYDMYKKIYKISDRFNKLLIKIGLMWVRQIR